MSTLLGKLMRRKPAPESESRQDNALALQHLRKLFSQFRNDSSDPRTQEQRLYSMVPLFNRVFESSPPTDMMDRFPEVLQFSSHVSKLLVSEIKRRAQDRSTDEANLLITQYLEIGNTSSPSNGWHLLSSVLTLAAGPDSIKDCMSACFLTSTLVKCVYLFFDLPAIQPGQGEGDITPAESRLLLQRTISQVLTRMCTHTTPAEELVHSKDKDLLLLFTAVSSPCPAYNHMWRKTTSDVLLTLSKNSLSKNIIEYIHKLHCIQECVNNIHITRELSPLEIVDIFGFLFSFLKDSSDLSPLLLEDFRSCDAYSIVSQFLLNTEEDFHEETTQAAKNLVLLVGDFTTCGYDAINPSLDQNSLFKLEGFILPKPAGKGLSVRNIQAFKVLHTVFLKSRTSAMCSKILEVINNIYHQDNANYFILEPQSTLPEFADVIHTKPEDIQAKYFELIEFIVTHLNFIPCKELNGMSLLLKANRSLECSLRCMKTVTRILDCSAVYKKVFGDVGLLEVLITCLHRFASTVKELHAEDPNDVSERLGSSERDLGFMVMNSLAVLLSGTSGSSAASYLWSNDIYKERFNEDVFRQCGGARCAHNLIPYEFCRRQALSLVKQLLLSTKGDDDMGTLLCLMQKEPPENTKIKISILKVIVSAMRESHRARTMFKKVDGFRYVMSMLLTMEGCLGNNKKAPWDKVDKQQILSLIQMIFCTLTIAMRYEPANVKFFCVEVQYNNLIIALRMLGCFSQQTDLSSSDGILQPSGDPIFKEYFMSSVPVKQFCGKPTNVPVNLLETCFLFRCLYDMALDHYDHRVPEKKAAYKRMTSAFGESDSHSFNPLRSSWNGSLNSLKLNDCEHTILHPGAITSMLKLIPSVDKSSDIQMSCNLQSHILNILRNLLNLERNQQVMCADGFVREMLIHCKNVLLDEDHPHHSSMQYMFELMASQSLQANDLREYLRLGEPLCCTSLDEWIEAHENTSVIPANGGNIPVNRVRCLVTMTTPRDVNLNGTSLIPPFVEFNMNYEGSGCLFMPSIAPQGPPNPSVVSVTGSSDLNIVGGTGQGERIFPPAYGLTYSSWICIDSSPSSSTNHPVWLLQIVRKLTDSSESLLCLRVAIDLRDKVFIISTKETPLLPSGASGSEPAFDAMPCDSVARIWCPQIGQEAAWQHVAVVLAKAGMLKNSSVSLYLNGIHISSQKLHYVSPNIGASSNAGTAQSATSVFAYIGTPPQLRQPCSLVWKQGSCFLIEEALSAAAIEAIFCLGPSYVGCLQAIPQVAGSDTSAMISLVGEDKIMVALHAVTSSVMTVSKIKRLYNKHDGKAVSNQLSSASQENSTPVRVIYNSASHLGGCARSLGAVVIGFNGVHAFRPHPVASVLNYIGGMSIMLGFVAMASDVEALYAAVKALVCVLKSTKKAQEDMFRINGYQLLAMLYKKKQSLLNSHILHLTFSLIGTIDSNKEITVIPNRLAFEDLLCDLEVWHDAPSDLQRSLYEHFYELLTEASGFDINRRIMREARLIKKILYVMRDNQLRKQTLDTLCSVLHILLYCNTNKKDILRFGQFIVATLPQTTLTEDRIYIENATSNGCTQQTQHNITLRNSCLDIIRSILHNSDTQQDSWITNQLIPILGFDWVLVFMQSHLHKTTIVIALDILLCLIRSSEFFTRFRDGVTCGGWLENSQELLEDRMLHGVNIENTSANKTNIKEMDLSMTQLPGFVCLQWLMQSHCEISELYYLLGCLLVNEKIITPPDNQPLTLDNLYNHFLSQPVENKKHHKHSENWNQEPAVIILSMIKSIMNMSWHNEEEGSWMREFPITLIQFLLHLYQRHTNAFRPIAMSADFLSGLASTLFQQNVKTRENSPSGSPEHHVSAGASNVATPDQLSDSFEASGGSEYRRNTLLTDHPAKRLIVDFIMKIILDSFALPPTKNTQVVEVVLNTCPPHSSKKEQAEFQTAILKLVMDHLLAADVLLGEQAAVQIHGTGSYSNIVAHVFFFTNLVVDKLWHGCYNKEAKEIFEFVKELLAQGKRRASGLALDSLYTCLNRTILFELSRQTDCIARRTAVLDTLHRLRDNRSLVFGPGNFDLEFIACLVHCLLELTSSRHQVLLEEGMTQWHIIPSPDELAAAAAPLEESLQLLVLAAERVWQELYVHKKPAIEESLKITLTVATEVNPSPRITTPSLASLRDKLADPASRTWSIFYENQKKSSLKDVEKFQKQIQSRLERVGTGMFHLATGKKTVKELPAMKQTTISCDEYVKWLSSHTSLVRELVDYNMTTYELDNQHMHEFIHEAWLKTERELLRERGIWGPPTSSSLDKYQLDMTEGPLRMRIKMEKNEDFYQHYPFRARTDIKPTKHKAPVSRDSEIFHIKRRIQSLIEEEPEQMVVSSNNTSIDLDPEKSLSEGLLQTPSLLPRKSLTRSETIDDEELAELAAAAAASNQEEGSQETSGLEESVRTNLENHQTLLRLLDDGEKISTMYKCARVQGLDSHEGILLFGKECYYVLDGFTLLSTNEIQDIDSIPEEYRDPIIPKVQHYTSVNKEKQQTKKICFKFYYEDIREVLKRRYLLQPIALEVFNADGRNVLLAFHPKDRNTVLSKFMTAAPSLTSNALQSVAGQKQSTKVEPRQGLFYSLTSEKSVTSRWERGEISNFQYLMHLNTLAGRSYNDLMQYPVFPWILADYTSEKLDLTIPETFRDLSKPMGAQTPDRLYQFQKRYKEWDDPTGETPPYHYGTHYSSAMIVASYLVRMEPFTQHFLRLQGGHFDLADRMFHTIKDAYESASKTNMADVKELIPEFFYLPDFLVNANKFDLGEKQSGVKLNHVGLPAWAKGDAKEFVRVHREALECDYVSAHLHEWIDLIFGYKQQGTPAYEANNVFHYLFYEGNVDIYSIDDPLKRNAIIGFINNFGQTPKQLFKKPHPPKKAVKWYDAQPATQTTYSISSCSFFFRYPESLASSVTPVKVLQGPVGQIICSDKAVLAVNQTRLLLPPNYNKYLAWGFFDLSLRICNYDSDRAAIIFENLGSSEIVCACSPNSKTIITAGSSTVVNVWNMTDKKGKGRAILKQPLYGHTDGVLCLAVSPAFNILVSGSCDKTCIIWDLSKLCYRTQLPEHVGPVAALCINDLTGVVASCASSWLYLWTVNGEMLASVDTAASASHQLLINCVSMTQANDWDLDNVILTGGSDGVVRMWSLRYREQTTRKASDIAQETPSKGSAITLESTKSLSYDHDPVLLLRDQSVDSTHSDLSVTSDITHLASSTATSGTPVPAQRRSLSVQSLEPVRQAPPVPTIRRSIKERKTWHRELVFRHKLTNHTAYERPENKEPAQITALTCSKDHRSVLVGDSKGRVFTYTMSEATGSVEHWIRDEEEEKCTQCQADFNVYNRKHHCRNCGHIFCGKCSQYEIEVPKYKFFKPTRVCLTCYRTLKQQADLKAESLNPTLL